MIRKNSDGSLLVWDKRNNIQIAVQGKFYFIKNVEKYWNQLSQYGKRQYGATPVPSTMICGSQDYTVNPSIDSFVVLKFRPEKFDILKLRKSGHKRAVFNDHSNSSWSGTWVVP